MKSEHFCKQVEQVSTFYDSWLTNHGKTRFSKLYEKFDNLERATDSSGGKYVTYHNCLGCNLKEASFTIREFLSSNRNSQSPKYYFKLFTIVFYLFAERLVSIHTQIHSSKNSWEHFPYLTRIKRWANFFKHPKAFFFIHHPTFHLASDEDRPNFMIKGVIDDAFVQKYYKSNNLNEELFKLLSNQTNHKVFFPDLMELAGGICKETQDFIDDILSDEQKLIFLSKFTRRD